MSELLFTGERFIPGTPGEIWVEHWHRYHFAARQVVGKRVLDVACGSGYGTALLARHAAHATGADLSQEAIDHAKRAYADLKNTTFLQASCTQLPLADASIDVAVSFETLEHIEGQEAFVEELARVLTPEGVLILSCPNKLEYSDRRGYQNEFHVKELYREELAARLGARFAHRAWYGQRPSFFSVIAAEAQAGAGPLEGELFEVAEDKPNEVAAHFTEPLYFLVVASRSAESLAKLPAAVSVLADRDDWVHRDYEKVMGQLQACVKRSGEIELLVDERDRLIKTIQDDQAALRKALAESAQREARLAVDLQEARGTVQAREATIAERDQEILRRRGLRWWLKLPFIRLGLIDEPGPL